MSDSYEEDIKEPVVRRRNDTNKESMKNKSWQAMQPKKNKVEYIDDGTKKI